MDPTATLPQKQLGWGFRLPVYGYGTWGLGGWFEADRTADAASVRAIHTALDHGVRHIDTAEMYGGGHTEELIGQALRGYDRTTVFLASKALAHHLDPAGLAAAVRDSLRRLATDYLDLYMIHHPSDTISIEETLAAMEALVTAGLVRFVGVSNFSRERLAAARAATRLPIAVNQVHYNLQVREPERSGLLDYCVAHDILLVAWKPLIPDAARVPLLVGLAEKYGKTPRQVALNWLVGQDNVVVVARTRDAGHLRENLGALDWRLDAADMALLRTHFPGQAERSAVYALR